MVQHHLGGSVDGPRPRVGSMAEAELLAPLAELLMPHLPIAEAVSKFSFPQRMGWKLLGNRFGGLWCVEG